MKLLLYGIFFLACGIVVLVMLSGVVAGIGIALTEIYRDAGWLGVVMEVSFIIVIMGLLIQYFYRKN